MFCFTVIIRLNVDGTFSTKRPREKASVQARKGQREEKGEEEVKCKGLLMVNKWFSMKTVEP